jgi:hypothetical protein
MTGNIKWLLAAAFAAILLPAAAQAQYPYGGMGYGGWGQSYYGQGMNQGINRVPPYFALHPPVYYSHETIRRPMGPSPFAYPGWYTPSAQRAAVVAAVPASPPFMIENPYVKAKGAANASLEKPMGLEVTNPFVAGK